MSFSPSSLQAMVDFRDVSGRRHKPHKEIHEAQKEQSELPWDLHFASFRYFSYIDPNVGARGCANASPQHLYFTAARIAGYVCEEIPL